MPVTNLLNHASLPAFKSYKVSFFNPAMVMGVIALINFLLSTQGYCMTDDDFSEEIEKANKLITGGYMHLGLMAMCGFGGIVCILERKLTGAIVCAAATLFVFM